MIARQPRDVIALGGSAGALNALLRLLPQVPPQLPATLLIGLHVSSSYRSRLADVLGPHCRLPVEPARDDGAIVRGRVYVVVPDLHLEVDSGRLKLTRGPKEHFTRPAIDVLFRSMARAYGPRAAGILLSGGGQDGTLGLGAIKAAGGITIAQDPKLVSHPAMLVSAIRSGNVDHVLTLDEIARALPRLAAGEPLDDSGPTP